MESIVLGMLGNEDMLAAVAEESGLELPNQVEEEVEAWAESPRGEFCGI